MSDQHTDSEADLIEFVRAIDVPAPAELHARVNALVAEHGEGARNPGAPRRTALRAGFATLAVAAAAVLVLLLLGGSGASTPKLNVQQATALTLRPATMAAPAENTNAHTQLAANVDGVSFPYWEDHFGWRATGARTDRIGGRTVLTVFYENLRGKRIGYAIVSGTPAPQLSGGTVVWRGGTPYRVLSDGDSHLVVWLRRGRMCVVAGSGVSSATLLRLASWNDHDDVA